MPPLPVGGPIVPLDEPSRHRPRHRQSRHRGGEKSHGHRSGRARSTSRRRHGPAHHHHQREDHVADELALTADGELDKLSLHESAGGEEGGLLDGAKAVEEPPQVELSEMLPCCPPLRGKVLHRLRDPARRMNWFSFLYVSMNNVSFLVFVSAIMPYSLENFLMVPEDQLGRASGDASFYDEIVVLLTAWAVGGLSDRIGRRWVTAVGAAIIAVAFFVFPFAETLPMFFLVRCLFALGVSCTSAMMTTVIGDLVPHQQQGVAMGVLGLFTGIGALIAVLVYLRLPEMAEHALGLGVVPAGFFVYWVVAFVAALSSIFALLFYQRRSVAREAGLLKSGSGQSYWDTLRASLGAVRSNPALSLACAASFSARGDAMILTTFLSLWVTRVARDVKGLSPAEASTRAGVVGGIAQTSAIVFAGVAGLVYHQFGPRKNLLALALLCAVASVSYGLMAAVDDPTSGLGMAAAAFAGAGEIGVVIGSQAFVAQESPQLVRGGVAGLFQFTGGLGIMLASKLGGWLVDKWMYGAPFALFSIFNGLCAIFGVILYILRVKGRIA